MENPSRLLVLHAEPQIACNQSRLSISMNMKLHWPKVPTCRIKCVTLRQLVLVALLASHVSAASLALQISNETAPPGDSAQIKIYAAAPAHDGLVSPARVALRLLPARPSLCLQSIRCLSSRFLYPVLRGTHRKSINEILRRTLSFGMLRHERCR